MINKIIDPNIVTSKMFSMPWSIYPYANYLKYGINNSFYSIFTINHVVFTQYHDSIQVCSETISIEEAKEISLFIIENNIRMASGSSQAMHLIFPLLNKGRIEDGLIFEFTDFECDKDYLINYAKDKETFLKIASLVCKANSSNTGYYALEQYFNQIYDRYSEGYCRNWVYSDDKDNIIGHIATYAETDSYAVLGGLAVDDNYRGQGIAKALLKHSINDLLKENKTIYAFGYNKNLYIFYKSISKQTYPACKIMLK